ncbi:MAG: hypothetical protein HDT05_05375 [Bacteroidales bacterium]|nr:hypothetical protein [Bacteroidales bacterium]
MKKRKISSYFRKSPFSRPKRSIKLRRRLLSICLIVSALAGFPFLGNAFRITGTIQSLPDNHVLAGANCIVKVGTDGVLLSGSSAQTGVFVCESPQQIAKNDSIVITVSKSGYESVRELFLASGDSIQDIGVIYLNQVNTLNEVTVDAKTVTVKDGNFLYIPPKSIVNASNQAIELIGKLGINGMAYNPIDRTISVRNENLLILVDGLQSSQEELRGIKASDVLNVEFSNNVPLIYASNYSCVINIRLKKRNDGGAWDITELNDFIGSAVNVGTGLSLYKGSSRLSVRYDLDYRNNKKTYDDMIASYDSPELEVQTKTQSHSPFNYKTHNCLLQYAYAPSQSLLFMAKYGINIYNTLRKSFMNIEDTFKGDYEGNERTHMDRVNQNINLYFSKAFGESNSLDIGADIAISNSDYNSILKYELPYPENEYLNDVNSDRVALNGKAMYSHTFHDKSILSGSYQFVFSNTRNKYNVTENTYRMKEANQHIYVQYQRNIIPNIWIMARTGIKIDHITENTIPHTYYNNNSALSVQYRISDKFTLGYNGTFSTQTLSLSLLQNNPVQINPYLVNNGNPDLKPSKILVNRLQFLFSNKNYSFGLTVQNWNEFDPINAIPIYEKDLKVYVNRPENCKHFNSTTLNLSMNIWNILKMFQIRGNLSYAHFQFENQNAWRNIKNSIGGDFAIGWYYKKFGADFGMTFPIMGSNGYQFSYWGEKMNYLSVQYRPIQNLSIGIQWAYMFDKKGWTSILNTKSPEYNYKSERQIHNNTNWIRLILSYNLNFGTAPKTKDRERLFDVRDSQTTFGDYTAK